MHRSEWLLDMHLRHDKEFFQNIHHTIQDNLGNGKSLRTSLNELTGTPSGDDSVYSGEQFSDWLNGQSADPALTSYYETLLLHFDSDDQRLERPTLASKEPTAPPPPPAASTLPRRTTRRDHVSKTKTTPSRHLPLRIVLAALLMTCVALGIRYTFDSNEGAKRPSQTETTVPTTTETTTESPGTDELARDRYVWLSEKTVNLFENEGDSDPYYVGDIGDRYRVLSEDGDVFQIELPDASTAWVKRASTTETWKTTNVTDDAILGWVEDTLESWFEDDASSVLALSGVALTDTLVPYATDADALNEYWFYQGGFLTLQDGDVSAIDWTKTGVTFDDFTPLGEAMLATDDALVYESESYLLRLFIGSDGSSRVRLSEK